MGVCYILLIPLTIVLSLIYFCCIFILLDIFCSLSLTHTHAHTHTLSRGLVCTSNISNVVKNTQNIEKQYKTENLTWFDKLYAYSITTTVNVNQKCIINNRNYNHTKTLTNLTNINLSNSHYTQNKFSIPTNKLKNEMLTIPKLQYTRGSHTYTITNSQFTHRYLSTPKVLPKYS